MCDREATIRDGLFLGYHAEGSASPGRTGAARKLGAILPRKWWRFSPNRRI